MQNGKLLYLLLLTCFYCETVFSQSTRYFEFSVSCGHGNWQDTSFIAAANDQVLIDSVLNELNKPIQQRKFIVGYIDFGNGSFNHNASHWFKWHFIPNMWTLTELAPEVCDGCPFADLDSDTAYWVNTVGQYCPWSGVPVREVLNPSGINTPLSSLQIQFFPNPAVSEIKYSMSSPGNYKAVLYNSLGSISRVYYLSGANGKMNVQDLPGGIYNLRVQQDQYFLCYKIVLKAQ